MSYDYRRRTPEEINALAREILERHKALTYGACAVDIERIIEAEGFDILYRKSLGIEGLKGYMPYDPKLIVMSSFGHPRELRYTAAHEFAHKILEAQLLKNGNFPDGAHASQLTKQQRKDIEENTWELAADLIEPNPPFAERYSLHRKEAEASGLSVLAAIYKAVRDTSDDFDVVLRASARRAMKLKIITAEEHGRAFTDKNLM